MSAEVPELSAALLSVLACPCPNHAPVRAIRAGDGSSVECTRCLTRFPIEDGIPVMLLDEAAAGPQGIGAPAAGT